MLKVWDIALKDLLHSFRSLFAVAMMFVIPLAITGLLFLAFGRSPGAAASTQLAVTRVVVFNLDQPPQGSSLAAGQTLLAALSSPSLAGIMQVSPAATAAEARRAVDAQEAGVAVIIPANLSQALLSQDETAALTLYQDPTLTVGPLIVRQVVTQILDGFRGASTGVSVLSQQFAARSTPADAAQVQDFIAQYTAWVQAGSSATQPLALQVESVAAAASSQGSSNFAGPIMIGMMIFFIFFTGAEEAQSIVREDEHKTLARLFTTATPRTLILAGKITSIFVILAVQTVVLLGVSALVFDIHWGSLGSVVLAALGTIAAAGGFGLFIMSFVKNNRQAGPVLGAVLTMTGVAGGTVTTGFQNLPAFYTTLNLLTPQGWALKAWKMSLAGALPAEMLLPVGVLCLIGLLFFALGAWLFRRRYA